MSTPIIHTENLTVYYGRHRGIVDVNLTVEAGEVFGFLGPNGAGKTTTQRVLLDLVRPTRGTARIFGLDCRERGREVRRRLGYLPGELSLYSNMTARRFLRLMAGLSGRDGENAYTRELCDRLDLDPARRIAEYSRGNKQKVGVIAAFMGRPHLVILDEPTTGLDPLVQRTVMELVRETREEGRSVFFSSHILQEVQAVCDRVGIIRDGRMVATESVDRLTRRRFKRLHLSLRRSPPDGAFDLDGVTVVSRENGSIVLDVHGELDPIMRTALEYGIVDVESQPVTLEEVFLAFYGRSNEGGEHVGAVHV